MTLVNKYVYRENHKGKRENTRTQDIMIDRKQKKSGIPLNFKINVVEENCGVARLAKIK